MGCLEYQICSRGQVCGQPGNHGFYGITTPCRGRFYCARRRVSEANRTAGPALRPEISARLAAAGTSPGGYGIRPYGRRRVRSGFAGVRATYKTNVGRDAPSRRTPRVGLAPLSKGAGCGESRRLGDCLEAGSRSRKAAQGGTLRVAAASGGGISGRGNPSDRAWRRGHLPLTREANGGAGPATNRETVILMLLRTRVGADSISARSAAARTPPGGYGIRPYNGFFNVAANRETTILALPRTCVGDDACIVPHPAAAQTHRVGGRFRGAAFRGRAIPPTAPGGAATSL